jgi:hypothetical protein
VSKSGAAFIDFGDPVPVEPAANRKASSNGMRTWVDGRVREAAIVYVNG